MKNTQIYQCFPCFFIGTIVRYAIRRQKGVLMKAEQRINYDKKSKKHECIIEQYEKE